VGAEAEVRSPAGVSGNENTADATTRRRHVSRVTRLKLLVLLPSTMGVLVAATGFFTHRMTTRVYLLYGLTGPAIQTALGGLAIEVALVASIAAFLGFALALGVTAPLKQVADRLEAVASGDLQGAIDIRSTSEVDCVAGAFNDAIRAINAYIFQSMTGAVIALNTDGVVIGSSPAAEVVLGYREEELIGKRFSEVFTPTAESRTALLAMEAAIARRRPVVMDDVVVAAKDGRPMRIDVNVSYLRPPAGPDGTTTVGVMIAFKDLTEIRRLRERLQQADRLVALGTLTAGVAHELRNPLASLQGLVELLGRDFPEDDPRRRYVTTMQDAIGRLDCLVEDLLLLSSPAAPSQELIDLNRMVRDTVTFARLGLSDKAVTISSIDSRLPAITLGNEARLGRALANILVNAVQATPPGGVVTASTTVSGTQAVVRVHNTGSYVSPEQMKKLFVPFYTTKSSGTGLGLAIARQIVTAHGGRIEVESDPQVGTSFAIELPLAAESLQPKLRVDFA
jgi:two-component system sensor histidine kinase AtoS